MIRRNLARPTLIIPDYCGTTQSGQARLNALCEQADVMTGILDELRAEGFQRVTFNQILHKLQIDRPDLAALVDPRVFQFTGKRIIPCERAFFKWFLSTPEGIDYETRAKALGADGMYRHFAKVEER